MRGNVPCARAPLALAIIAMGSMLAAPVLASTLPWRSASIQTPTADPLAGRSFSWTLTEAPIEGMTCQESWYFNHDGTVRYQSGAEITTHQYRLDRDQGSGVTLMTRTRLTSNGGRDCTGLTDASTGQVRQTILRFQGDGSFLTCTDLTLESCYGKGIATGQVMARK